MPNHCSSSPHPYSRRPLPLLSSYASASSLSFPPQESLTRPGKAADGRETKGHVEGARGKGGWGTHSGIARTRGIGHRPRPRSLPRDTLRH
eukprot:8642461-Pyramimonas_sp.AAC.1